MNFRELDVDLEIVILGCRGSSNTRLSSPLNRLSGARTVMKSLLQYCTQDYSTSGQGWEEISRGYMVSFFLCGEFRSALQESGYGRLAYWGARSVILAAIGISIVFQLLCDSKLVISRIRDSEIIVTMSSSGGKMTIIMARIFPRAFSRPVGLKLGPWIRGSLVPPPCSRRKHLAFGLWLNSGRLGGFSTKEVD